MGRQPTIEDKWRPVLITALLLATTLLVAQTSAPEPNRPQHPRVPTVTFTCDWPSVEPHRYVVSVDSSGNAAYQSWTAESEAGQTSADDPYMVNFTMSAGARDRVFAVLPQLRYFSGDFEYRKHRVAFTGNKVLSYADADKRYETRYNWSENPAVDQLTALFQGISTTIESGRRLTRLHRFDRLGLDEELKSLEHLATEHRATELQIIAPTLEQLAADVSILNIARQRARHILQLAAAEAPTGSAASAR